MWHSYKNGKSSINGYLEDYCFTIEAYLALYEASFNEKWLTEAKKLADYSINHFHDVNSGMFFFTDKDDPKLIARKMEVNDNVIPSSNSSMAKGLFLLSKYFENDNYLQISQQMVKNVQLEFNSYLSGYSNWATLALNFSEPFYELAISGTEAEEKVLEIYQNYIPNKLVVGNTSERTTLPLLENKWIEGQTTIYVCENKVCQLPVTSVDKAKSQILFQ